MSDYHTQDPDLPLFAPPKRARDSDPDTSHDAATYATRKLGHAAGLFLESLAMFNRAGGKPTANEVADYCSTQDRGLPESYRKRAGELERAGLIRVAGKRTCRVTGRPAQQYEVVR